MPSSLSHLSAARRSLASLAFLLATLFATAPANRGPAQEPPAPEWKYDPELLRPFWLGDTILGESVLFIREREGSEAKAAVLFPIRRIVKVANSEGTTSYEEGRDFRWEPGQRTLTLPPNSRIVAKLPADLRRPANSQKYQLTHRDGNGEIFFGAKLEYHAMQTCVTYERVPEPWPGRLPRFEPQTLPKTVERLRTKQPLSIVLLGDSISAGLNASALGEGPPYQPAYPELVRRHLFEHYQAPVQLTNLAISGRDTQWALTQIDKVKELQPNLVLIAFGMNDSAGRSAADYQANTKSLIEKIRAAEPNAEFILVASMLGNRDWIRLKHELFPEYRQALEQLCGPGIALADVTSVWTRFLERKLDWDQTGNGVNHPNDWGHRVYAQIITSLLIPRE